MPLYICAVHCKILTSSCAQVRWLLSWKKVKMDAWEQFTILTGNPAIHQLRHLFAARW